MIIELPESDQDITRVLHYLNTAKIPYEEVGKDDL